MRFPSGFLFSIAHGLSPLSLFLMRHGQCFLFVPGKLGDGRAARPRTQASREGHGNQGAWTQNKTSRWRDLGAQVRLVFARDSCPPPPFSEPTGSGLAAKAADTYRDQHSHLAPPPSLLVHLPHLLASFFDDGQCP